MEVKYRRKIMTNKIGKLPEFTEGGETSSEEVKEQEQNASEETEITETESSEENKSTEENNTNDNDNKTSESEKLKALEELRKQEDELNNDVTNLDIEIKARRDKIVQKRAERREKRDLIDKIGDKLPETQEDNLQDIDSTTLQILDRYTRSKGLVPKSELENINYENQHKTAEQAFYERHKEYLPENDKNDILYNALKVELSLYAKPNNPVLITKLFEKAHYEVKRQYPHLFKDSTLTEKVNASQRIGVSSIGGGNTGGSSRQTSSKGGKLSQTQINILSQGGWTEEEITKLNS